MLVLLNGHPWLYPTCSVLVCVRIHTHAYTYTPTPVKIRENTENNSICPSAKNNPPRQQHVHCIDQLKPPTLVPILFGDSQKCAIGRFNLGKISIVEDSHKYACFWDSMTPALAELNIQRRACWFNTPDCHLAPTLNLCATSCIYLHSAQNRICTTWATHGWAWGGYSPFPTKLDSKCCMLLCFIQSFIKTILGIHGTSWRASQGARTHKIDRRRITSPCPPREPGPT